MTRFFTEECALSIIDQLCLLRADYPHLDSWIDERGTLTAEGCMPPTPSGTIYEVRIIYRFGELPKVMLASPSQRPFDSGGGSLFRRFGVRTCMVGVVDDWAPDMPLGRLIIPRIERWLADRETWQPFTRHDAGHAGFDSDWAA